MHRGRSEGRNRETMRKRDAEHIVAGGFDRTDPDKDQRKRSNEFSEARAEFIHPSMQSNCPLADNLVVAARSFAVFRCAPTERGGCNCIAKEDIEPTRAAVAGFRSL